MHEQSRGLQDRDQRRVRMQDFEGRIKAYCAGRPRIAGDRCMAGSKRGGKGSGRAGPPSAFTRVRRLPERGVYDAAAIHAVLDATPSCVVAHVVDGRPVATPTLHWRIGERVYWHGSVASRMLRSNAGGGEVCLTVTLMDGWVLARSAFNHTVNYRSVMCFGRPAVVADADKERVLETFTEHWFPGRWAALRPVNRRELGATTVLSMPLDVASAKIRDGGAGDPERDLGWPVWAGVIPFRHALGTPVPEPGLAPGLPRARVVVHGGPAKKPRRAAPGRGR
jgi:nitroimidazol reductase NimA-like FMN-containing flavoprotein (pyridoxamine 5'-phosphate oxidase superfamily)